MNTYVDLWYKHINQAIFEFQPDIIHAHHVWVTPYVASGTGLPYVISVHGTDLMGFRNGPRYREMALTAAQKADGLIAISRQVQTDTLETYGVLPEKVHLIANGFDLDIFKVIPVATKAAVQPQLDIEATDGPLVSFVGKFTS